ncbi:MAG TPA: biotin--[acetyl-CoA-carboxylase] ligase [Gemmataceae bacterium]|nr:biotin--[acetyl-CoA-carboxylase] ligase [Gemmataceae bacterium]
MISANEGWHFDTTRIGQRVIVFDEVESTNSLAATFPAADGLVIVARNQTAGRGRFGRVWQSRPGSSLLMSVVLHPPAEIRRPSVLTAMAAVAVGDAVQKLCGVQARIKWPNDLLVRGKKVCGILIEQGTSTVVGIGLNLNQTAPEFAAAGLPDASSLGIVSGVETDLRTATGAVVACLDAEYTRLLGGERVAVEADWKWRTGLLGRQVAVELTDGTFVRGRMREISFDALEVELPDGDTRTIVPETVAHVRALE